MDELRAIGEAVAALAAQMDSTLPEERMTELVSAALAEERRGRLRLVVAAVSPVLIVLAVAIATLAQSNANHRQGRQIQATATDAKVVADYVRDCLITPTAKRDPARCNGDDTKAVIGALIQAIDCGLLIAPEDRTQAKLDACTARAFSGATR